MVDKKLVQDTIIELLDANIDKDTIYSTLKDIGVDDGDIETNYTEIINAKKEKKISKKEITEEPKEEKIEEKYSQIEEPKIEAKEEVIKNFNINEKDTQEDDLIETTSEVNSINEKEDADIVTTLQKKETPTPIKNTSINNTSVDNSDVQDQLSEIKAQLKALTKIMKDILEENRNILNKL